MSKQRVLVAMSGGVDSSVAALLLSQQGYEIVGAHMKLWDYLDVGGDIYQDGRCCSVDSIADCRLVCDRIDAPFHVLNLSQEFSEYVIKDFVEEYKSGRTPNPCVLCNTGIKWKAFLQKAEELGCDFVATGHYSFVERAENRRWYIRKGVDETRDQSYVLWGLGQSALARTLMPLGGFRKSEIREIAQQHDLKTADKTESREICFVADDDYRRFLREWGDRHGGLPQPGEIVHADGTVLGRHESIAFYTIGQRRGLGISHPTPLYVQEIDVKSNRVIVGNDDTLYKHRLVAEKVNWVARSSGEGSFEADVKIRYMHQPARATIKPLTASTVEITFDKKQRAITPGQSVVFYDADIVLGGGTIARVD
ncbi:MAG: tRNA 2-thiouridine(34) synthase MnmA [Candidatus Zixiibacteriota bacterium]|nr:MAG: tRNA 2-thiouridine(34) synthase MnmA [candidate division Zixibacteria bacterium]